ncbi:MAG: Ig-like domain-containing protein [Bacteroidales bacterium]
MTKTITIFSTIFILFSTLHAQIYFDENFQHNVFPPENWDISSQPGNWSLSETSEAGGEAPEVKFHYQPQFDGKTRLITPELDLSNINADFLVISFLHSIDRYTGFFSVGLSYRVEGGAWKNIWEENIYHDIPSEEKAFVLKNNFPVNSSNIQFSFYFDGKSSNINSWFIDNIKLFFPEEYDASLSSIDIPGIVDEPLTIAGSIKNKGNLPLYSFDLNWRINHGDVHTESFFGFNAEYAETINFETTQTISPQQGENHVEFFISNVNGTNSDSNPHNDTITRRFTNPVIVSDKKPLFESFTSSTCPPCASFNLGFFNSFLQNNEENLSVVKYQMNWPGSGDPYFNSDGNSRRGYYSVSSVPDLIINGSRVSVSSGAVNNAFNNVLQEKTLVDITGAFYIDGNDIHIEGSVLPYADHEDLTLQIAILENSTTGNASTNGETVFYSVMMKMLPNANGTTLDLSSGESVDFSHSVDMTSTNVEEMSDLNVLVFLQEDNTKNIVQSSYLSGSEDGAPLATSEPQNGDTGISVWEKITITFDQQIQLPQNKRIKDDEIHSLVSFYETSNPGNTVNFTTSVNAYGNQFAVQPNEYLQAETQYTIEVGQVQGYWGTQSDPLSFTFTTRAPLGAPEVTVDPGDGSENIDLHHTSFQVSFDQQVKGPDGEFLQDEDIEELVNLFEENTEGEEFAISGIAGEDHTQFQIAPDQSLLPGKTYVLQIDPVLGEDNVMSNLTEISFSTRTSVGAPSVHFHPINNSSDLEPEDQLMIIFSQPVRLANGNAITPLEAPEYFTLMTENEEEVDIELEVEINNTDNIFLLNAIGGFALNTSYQLKIAPLMGLEGDLTEEITYQFSTRESFGPPEAEFDPSPQSLSVPVNKTLNIAFNQSVRLEDGSEITSENISQAVLLQKGTGNEGEAIAVQADINTEKTEISIQPLQDLAYNQQYTINISALLGVDNELSEPISSVFTTEISFNTAFPEFPDVKIFPNPASGILHIEGLPQMGEDLNIRLLSIEPKMIFSERIQTSFAEIPVHHLQPGVYFLEIINDEKVFRKKVTIVR